MAKGFAASRATLRADEIGANPMTPDFTMWIYTLNGGARHKGHNALPSVAARSLSVCEPLGQQGNAWPNRTNERIVTRG